MFCKVSRDDGPATLDEAGLKPEGRFVLHRHTDAQGDHLDLRLECEGYLLGWRIDGTDLDDAPWASEKAPHPLHWLDDSTDLTREAVGVYGWERLNGGHGTVLLESEEGCMRVHIDPVDTMSPRNARSIHSALNEIGVAPEDAADLIHDGATARARAIERLCGLGRELDKGAFEATLWRRSLSAMNLDEIHAQLRAFEDRFDREHPPLPISQPELLEEDPASSRNVLDIVRG